MKRKLFLFALVCSMGMFASCSDDSNSDWKNIPTTEITGENAVLTVNGKPQSGSIKLQIKDANSGVLALNKLLLGFDNVNVDVTLTAQGDGSFNFEGAKMISNADVKANIDLSVATDVKVNGNITLDGKAKVTVTTTINGGLVGTWSFADSSVWNEEVTLHVVESPILFKWPAKNYDEEHTIKDGYQVGNVASSLVPHILAEVLNQVTFNADGSIVAKYYPTLETEGVEIMDWVMASMNKEKIAPISRTWIESQKSFASWYVKGEYIYVLPNIEVIMGQLAAGSKLTYADIIAFVETLKASSDVELMSTISALLASQGIEFDLRELKAAQVREVLGWVTTGIPFKYKSEAGYLYIHVDKKMVSPFMPFVLSLLPMLQEVMDEAAIDNPQIGILPFFLGVDKLVDFKTIWDTNTSDVFELGLMMKK